MTVQDIKNITNRIQAKCLGEDFLFRVAHDVLNPGGRIFIQAMYGAPCTKTGYFKVWYGRKYYLSSHMTKDEIVKTAYVAFKTAVEHEVMEGFKVDGKILFNPHINFESLLAISGQEVKREEIS